MPTEIKRNSWARFCRTFNRNNQYRRATVSIKRRNEDEIKIDCETLFMGVALTKKGRCIDGIEFFTVRHDPEHLNTPILSVKQPVSITVEKDADGRDNCLRVAGKDGDVASVVLTGEKDPEQYRALVQKVAYSIYERRGVAPGSHVDDWLEAEHKVREMESSFVR